jgi:hypothetical protein
MGRRLLARFDPDGLREHVEGNRLLPSFKLAMAAEAMHVLQISLVRIADDET